MYPLWFALRGPFNDLDTKFRRQKKHNTSLLIIFKTKEKYKAISCKFPHQQQRMEEAVGISTFSCYLALKS